MATGDRLFGDMSRPEHAYALGAVAAAGRVRDGVLEIRLRGDGQPLLGMLEARTASDIPSMFDVRKGRVRIFAPLDKVASRYLGASPGDRVNLRFPDMDPDMSWAFLRGIFDASGSIASPNADRLTVKFPRLSDTMQESLIEFLGVRPSKDGNRWLTFHGAAALDLLGHLYDGFNETALLGKSALQGDGGAPPLCRQKHLRRYQKWCRRIVGLRSDGAVGEAIIVQRLHPEAVLPGKSRVSDSGYDLTLLYEKKRVGRVVLYGTGLIVEPPQGWYLDVVARSSIIKSGYMLANNVGVIDRAYRGELMVPLLKVDPAAPELRLPARVVQAIPRPIMHFEVRVIRQASSTQRGTGGFGSSG